MNDLQKLIKAFLVLNPNSNVIQIWNGIGGSLKVINSELKNLITNREVEYSLIDYSYCVRERKKKMNNDDIKNETYKMVETLFSVYDAAALANRLGISRSMLNSLKVRQYNHNISAATYLKIKELYDDYRNMAKIVKELKK